MPIVDIRNEHGKTNLPVVKFFSVASAHRQSSEIITDHDGAHGDRPLQSSKGPAPFGKKERRPLDTSRFERKKERLQLKTPAPHSSLNLLRLKVAILAGCLAGSFSVGAAPINPENILVSIGISISSPHGTRFDSNTVVECTPSGQVVQTIPFQYRDQPYPETEFLRDIVVDQYGSLYAFNGTFNPFLTRYLPNTQTFTHKAFPDWDLINAVYGGAIAAYGNFIFVADQSTFAGPRSGIVRFDTANNAAVRFADGTHVVDLNIGLDGNIYALPYGPNANGPQAINVYDPHSLTLIKQVNIPSAVHTTTIRAIAVDGAGRIFLCGQEGTVFRLNQSGQVETTKSTGYAGLGDMEIDKSGRLLIGQPEGRVILGDTSLQNNFTSFLAINDPRVTTWTVSVSFAQATAQMPGPLPTPTPTPVATPTPSPAHDIMVALGGSFPRGSLLREFSPAGVFLREIPFKYEGMDSPNGEWLRDIVAEENGVIYGYNGTSDPRLTRYSWPPAAFSDLKIEGWDSDSNGTAGGIASYGGFIFLTDNGVAASRGIVRVDKATNAYTRLGEGLYFLDLNIGLDGKLYGLYSQPGAPNFTNTHINVYDPETLALLKTLTIPPDIAHIDDIRSIAADATGRIFLSSWHGTVFRLDPAGVVQASAATGLSWLFDMDLDETGRLIFAQMFGRIVVGDVEFQNFTSFQATKKDENFPEIFVTFSPLIGPPPQLVNLSTRLKIGAGAEVGIGGFIITGTAPKKVLLRGVGPSLAAFGLQQPLEDPALELRASNGALIASNDDWEKGQAAEIRESKLAPSDSRESALLQTLSPGAYTAIVSGQNGSSGVGLVELYDLSGIGASKLGNISTRGRVNVNDDAVIGGLIVGGGMPNSPATARVAVRGMGPSLTQSGINGALQDPTIAVYNGNGATIAANDDWSTGPILELNELSKLGLAPFNSKESMLLVSLVQGNYTAVLRGAGNTAGIGLVEIYHLE